MNSKLEKQQKKLVEAGMMDPSDTLIDYLQASYVERLPGKMGGWKQGWVYFTEEKLIIMTGLSLSGNIIIPYRNIRKLGKCSQSFLPIGIVITHEETENGKTTTDKISLMKRDKWLGWIAQKAGISVS